MMSNEKAARSAKYFTEINKDAIECTKKTVEEMRSETSELSDINKKLQEHLETRKESPNQTIRENL